MSAAVIGLGNVLLGDDGFGPYVIELLARRYEFPPRVELHDLGTPGLGLITYLHGHEAIVIVDAAAISAVPGQVRLYDERALRDMPAVPRVSPHDPAVAEALSVARAASTGPLEACLVAARPGCLELGAGLTPELLAAAEVAAGEVVRWLEDRGHPARRRAATAIEEDWWRRRPPATGSVPFRAADSSSADAARAGAPSRIHDEIDVATATVIAEPGIRGAPDWHTSCPPAARRLIRRR